MTKIKNPEAIDKFQIKGYRQTSNLELLTNLKSRV